MEDRGTKFTYLLFYLLQMLFYQIINVSSSHIFTARYHAERGIDSIAIASRPSVHL